MTVAVEIISSTPAWTEEQRRERSRIWGRKVEGQPFDMVIVEARFGDYKTVLAFRGSPIGEPILVLQDGEECPISEEGLKEVCDFLKPYLKEMAQQRTAS